MRHDTQKEPALYRAAAEIEVDEESIPFVSNEGRGSSPRLPTIIGPSLVIKGELASQEDIVVEGCIEGDVKLPDRSLRIARTGKVAAHVHARSILIEGEARGELNGEEQLLVRQTARIRGSLLAPIVEIEDGCRFTGCIDLEMCESLEKESRAKQAPASENQSPGDASGTGAGAKDSAGR